MVHHAPGEPARSASGRPEPICNSGKNQYSAISIRGVATDPKLWTRAITPALPVARLWLTQTPKDQVRKPTLGPGS
eukprot:7032956-Prymnesium_polylepis.1